MLRLGDEKTFRDIGSGFDRTVVANEMKKNKSKFDLDIFFDELSENLSEYNVRIEHMIRKANGNEKLSFDPNYNVLGENFSKLDNSLKYERLFDVKNEDSSFKSYWVEYGYLSSNRSDKSFLIAAESLEGNGYAHAIKMFNEIKKSELSELPNLIYEHYKSTIGYKSTACHEVNLNADYKWDLKYLTKLLNKSLNERIKQAKEIKKGGGDFNHTIKIYRTKGRKSMCYKILKEPLTLMQRFKK